MMKSFVCKSVGVSATLALCLAAQAGEDCASATVVGLGTNAFVAGAVTDNNPAATCGGFPNVGGDNDAYFTFTPAAAGTYTFETCNVAPGFFDTVLSVYSGTCGATTQLGCADDSGCGTNGWSSRVAGLSLNAGETYIIRVAAYDSGSLGDGNGVLTIIQTGGGTPPANDTCAAPAVAVVGANAFNNLNATNEGPFASCGFGGSTGFSDVFFTFTAPAADTYQFDTCASIGLDDTIIQVIDTCGGSELACNDDANCGPVGLNSSVSVAMTASQTVLVRVSSWAAADAGDGVLTIGSFVPPPPGETCANPAVAVLGANAFDTTGMANDDTTNCGGSGPDAFFVFTPATSGAHVFSTCGTAHDTTLAVLTDDCLTEIACDDDTCAPASTVTVTLTAGVPVRVQVDGFGGAFGAGTLTISDNVPLGIQGGFSGGPELTTVQVGAFVTPGNPPPSTGIVATADLSSIGGSATQALYDDGTNGDPVAGDNVYIYEYTFPITVQTGTYIYPISVSDAQGRTASATSQVDVFDGPSGGCCISGSCTLARETTCFASAGAWQGNGSGCGGPSYVNQVAGVGNDFFPIAGTGTMLATVSACDDCVEDLAMPFPFNFYGAPVSNIAVSSNGNIQFVGAGLGNAQFGNTNIPAVGGPENAIYPAWDDYNTADGGDVYYQVFGTSPNQVLKISWEGVSEFGGVFNNNNFQVTLFEGSDSFIMQYGNMDNLPEAFAGDVTIGTEDSTGTSATQQSAAVVTDDSEFEWNFTTLPGPCGPACDSIDFNNDGLFPDTMDIDDFLSVFSGGPCSNDPSCGDIDYNNDGLFPDTLDIDALLSVFSGGPCLV
ncbi:MAG TPA: choice-of-anchor X domain-containing protein [Phycisphaerales bacterium]|nr:choice-of-anchor X domain-containing protein [Phycisphaerales bacterium]